MADDKPLQQFYEALKHPVGASNHAAGHPDVCVPPQKPAQAPPLQAISQEKSLAPTMPDVEIIEHLNSNGKLVLRGLVNNEDDLLRVAEYHAGEGGLDKWKKMKPDFWESPDGMREIEWNPQGHPPPMNEGPHVTIRQRVTPKGRQQAQIKYFIRGQEQWGRK